MTKAWKGLLCGGVLIAAIAAPACRHKTTPVKPTVQPTETMTMMVPPVPTTTTVAPPVITNTDFVQTDTQPIVRTEELSTNIEEANRQAQLRGFIKDAYFGYDEAALSADAQAALSESATWLKRNSQYNLALGDHRANTAKEYLMTLGIDSARIRTVSYGEERPFDPGHDESAWAKNRRAHLVLVGR